MKAQKILVLLATLFVFSGAVAETDKTLPGLDWYGFDWLNPETAKCTRMTKKLLMRFQSCKYDAEERAFGSNPTETFTCTVNEHIEYKVYKNKEICENRIGYMEAIGETI